MKNKKVTYLLGFAVIAIWVLIFARIFSYTKTDVDQEDVIIVKKSFAGSTQRNDTVLLIANYPDPFLGDIGKIDKGRGKIKPKSKTPPKKVVLNQMTGEVAVKWPDIVYKGTIHHKTSGSILGLANIDGKEYLIYEGNIYENVEIIKLFSDSVSVEFKEEKRIIRK